MVDVVPSKVDSSKRNTRMKSFLSTLLGLFLTCNPSVKIRAIYMHDYFAGPKNDEERKYNQERVFTNNPYLSQHPKLAQYMDLKGNLVRNIYVMKNLLDVLCGHNAGCHTDTFKTGSQAKRMNPQKAYRWIHQDIYTRIMTDGIICEWKDIQEDNKGVLWIKNVIFFTERIFTNARHAQISAVPKQRNAL